MIMIMITMIKTTKLLIPTTIIVNKRTHEIIKPIQKSWKKRKTSSLAPAPLAPKYLFSAHFEASVDDARLSLP